jgi:mono/diheme cytochrome c family protein
MKSLLHFTLPVFAAFVLVSCASHRSGGRVAQAPLPALAPLPDASSTDVSSGRTLFLKNCAHCHGADARGDEGPDLHNLDWTDEQIAMRIRNGKKGQMTAFAGEFSADDIRTVIGYLRTLK